MTGSTAGLTREQAEEILMTEGPNEIFRPARVSFFAIARHEVTEPMILLLLIVGIVYAVLGREITDAITIFAVIALLVLAEVWNEFRAKKAIAALGEIAAPKARVRRDGEIAEIDARGVVPQDILVLFHAEVAIPYAETSRDLPVDDLAYRRAIGDKTSDIASEMPEGG